MLENWRTAPVGEPLRAMLGFLEKLTLAPDTVGPADIALLRAAGLTDAAIEDAITICFLFNVIDRIADALGFEVPAAEVFSQRAHRMLAHGYGRFVVGEGE